ncbi:uncharacterized protein KD926_001547 [Aspergillus affinis]|uniref:uncharacterized protein n=1 Tax=Aspergillus affinis TaxID=1070780 RepID=UPI0022FE0D49|nr:uncharacterized protein KD926_001547 [Aspergillus affinis]KAI9044316.1 hypothetical protein KD926_001547 [Aspergillus affinis]
MWDIIEHDESIKATFKFYSDWALFQTSDPTKDNYVSAEYVTTELVRGQTPATVGSLGIRFDQKGHERPFQKAVIVDVRDGYLNPGDRILIRLGDRHFGGKGTRVQTFIEKDFRWRLYIDPVGTSRFAPIQPDISWAIVAGPPHHIQSVSRRLMGNVTRDLKRPALQVANIHRELQSPFSEGDPGAKKGWTNVISDIQLAAEGDYTIDFSMETPDGPIVQSNISHNSVSSDLTIPKVLFGDLHVHSDDTVGTEKSVYNFSYGREIAGLDPGKFVIYPGTEWCGNSAAGGDHNVVFLDDSEESPAAFPYDRQEKLARSFERSTLSTPKTPINTSYSPTSAAAAVTLPGIILDWSGSSRSVVPGVSLSGFFKTPFSVAGSSAYLLIQMSIADAAAGAFPVLQSSALEEVSRVSSRLDSIETVASSLQSRHTFATTGQRLVGLLSTRTEKGDLAIQGDEIDVSSTEAPDLEYHSLGERGFSSIEAFDASGLLWRRHFWSEAEEQKTAAEKKKVPRITWDGARLYDRYREAIWDGQITLSQDAAVERIQPFGGLEDNPEDVVRVSGSQTVEFASKTSGDVDGVNIYLQSDKTPSNVSIRGLLGGYIKVGDALAGNPHKPQPNFEFETTWEELVSASDGKSIEIRGGAGLFVRVEAIPDIELPRRVKSC